MFKKVFKSKAKSQKSLFLMTFFLCLIPIASKSQCAMCRAALQNNENAVQAEAVNDGIVFLMIMPYLLVALVGYGVYKIMKAKKAS